MKALRSLTAEDKLILICLLFTFGGIILGAILREPNLFGFTSILVILMIIERNFIVSFIDIET